MLKNVLKNLSWPTQISKKSQLFHFLVKKNLSWPTQNPPHFSQKSQLATSLTEEAHAPGTVLRLHIVGMNHAEMIEPAYILG